MLKKILQRLKKTSKVMTQVAPTLMNAEDALRITEEKINQDFENAIVEVAQKISEKAKSGDTYTFIFPAHSNHYKPSMEDRMVLVLEVAGYHATKFGKMNVYGGRIDRDDHGVIHIQWDKKSLEQIKNKYTQQKVAFTNYQPPAVVQFDLKDEKIEKFRKILLENL